MKSYIIQLKYISLIIYYEKKKYGYGRMHIA